MFVIVLFGILISMKSQRPNKTCGKRGVTGVESVKIILIKQIIEVGVVLVIYLNVLRLQLESYLCEKLLYDKRQPVLSKQ